MQKDEEGDEWVAQVVNHEESSSWLLYGWIFAFTDFSQLTNVSKRKKIPYIMLFEIKWITKFRSVFVDYIKYLSLNFYFKVILRL